MEKVFYEKLQRAFVDIRSTFSEIYSECDRLVTAQDTLKQIKREILKEKKSEDNRLLLYCIDTMFDILNEGNREKIYDFADVVHNIPEICMIKNCCFV